jgi:hypothetical protein
MSTVSHLADFFSLLFGWWLPALLFYVFGIVFLLGARRRPARAIYWLVAFLACLTLTLYDGVYLRHQFDQRADVFKAPVTYADPPREVRVIELLAEHNQRCDVPCVNLFFSGRFDKMIISYKDPSQGFFKPNGPKRLYQTYTIITEPGCRTSPLVEKIPNLMLWEQAGRCIIETRSETIDSRRFLLIEDQDDDPKSPPWPIRLTYIQLVDGDRTSSIARAEFAVVGFTFPFPVPGIFPYDLRDEIPQNFHAGFLYFERSYGQPLLWYQFVGKVFGISLIRAIPKPDTSQFSDN